MTEMKNKLVLCELCHTWLPRGDAQETADGTYYCTNEQDCHQSHDHQIYFDAKGG